MTRLLLLLAATRLEQQPTEDEDSPRLPDGRERSDTGNGTNEAAVPKEQNGPCEQKAEYDDEQEAEYDTGQSEE